ncbi:hypothetical protein BHYA_0114g00290 [Botrytis hyacinthi]|uniref:Uncharacterized protein n=1 Tax=Botrytis hyacinthi TaxID=278943 RepID=A0A4Z1GJH9_9HELO|nr:hypothetical protein BHYA_0114g00290 [Botrytis hyacinthi]
MFSPTSGPATLHSDIFDVNKPRASHVQAYSVKNIEAKHPSNHRKRCVQVPEASFNNWTPDTSSKDDP